MAGAKSLMHKVKSFPLRLPETKRKRARRLAQELGYSENRLYAELIQEGLLMREQMVYFERLRAMRVSPEEGLALPDKASDREPDDEDTIPDVQLYQIVSGRKPS